MKYEDTLTQYENTNMQQTVTCPQIININKNKETTTENFFGTYRKLIVNYI